MTGGTLSLPVSHQAKLLRALIIAAVLIVGFFATRHSLGLVLATRNPALALRIDRENALVSAQVAQADLLSVNVDAATRVRASALAHHALARDASNVTALVALGLAGGSDSRSAPFFTTVERLSRRNLWTELWLIEAAVAKGHNDEALRHYDNALRTKRSAAAILFPVLVNATADSRLLPAIARTLAQRPLWGGLYLQQLAQSGRDLNHIALLFADLKRRDVDTGIAADAALYDRLFAAQLYADAWSVYASGHRGTPRQGLRNVGFSAQPARLTPFDWQATNDEFVSAQIEKTADGKNGLIFSTAAGEGGDAAQQTTMLDRGTYIFRIVSDIQSADAKPPEVRITCLPSGAESVSVPLVRQRIQTQFSVPAACPAQIVTLTVRQASELESVTGVIRRAEIVPVG